MHGTVWVYRFFFFIGSSLVFDTDVETPGNATAVEFQFRSDSVALSWHVLVSALVSIHRVSGGHSPVHDVSLQLHTFSIVSEDLLDKIH